MSELNTQSEKKLTPLTLGLITAVILLVIALAIVLIPGKDKHNSASSDTSSSQAVGNSEEANSEDSSASKCGAGSSDNKEVLDAAPTNTKWVSLPSGWLVPQSDTAGALDEHDGLHDCFEHSPEGALYGAVWVFTQLNDPATNRAAIDNLLADSPGKTIAQQENQASASDSEVATLKGYKYINYDPESATIKLLYSATTSGINAELTVNMVWENGDWKMRVPDTTDLNIQQVTDTSSYIMWGK